jgi:hypothetical protein
MVYYLTIAILGGRIMGYCIPHQYGENEHEFYTKDMQVLACELKRQKIIDESDLKNATLSLAEINSQETAETGKIKRLEGPLQVTINGVSHRIHEALDGKLSIPTYQGQQSALFQAPGEASAATENRVGQSNQNESFLDDYSALLREASNPIPGTMLPPPRPNRNPHQTEQQRQINQNPDPSRRGSASR